MSKWKDVPTTRVATSLRDLQDAELAVKLQAELDGNHSVAGSTTSVLRSTSTTSTEDADLLAAIAASEATEGTFTHLTDADDDADADYALALQLQAEEEERSSNHYSTLSRPESILASYRARTTTTTSHGHAHVPVRLSADDARPAASNKRHTSISLHAMEESSDNEHDHDTIEHLDEALRIRLRGRVMEMRPDDGTIVTKHDPAMAARRNARTIERLLGDEAGDMSGTGYTSIPSTQYGALKLPQSAVSTLQRHVAKQTRKGQTARGRVERETQATSQGALDESTRLTLFNTIAQGRLQAIEGIVAAGKEAQVLLGCGFDHDTHALATLGLATGDGWLEQRSAIWPEFCSNPEGVAMALQEARQGYGLKEGEEEEEEDNFEDVNDTDLIGVDTDEDGEEEEEEESPATGGTHHPSKSKKSKLPPLAAIQPLQPWDSPPGIAPYVAIKLFRVTKAEFSNRLDYVDGDRRWRSARLQRRNPRKLVAIWAAKEYCNLLRMRRAGLPCPAPLMLRSNILVMSFISAYEDQEWPAPQLREIIHDLSPIAITRAYAQTIEIIYTLYHWCHLIHADLSEYNLLWVGASTGRIQLQHDAQEDAMYEEAMALGGTTTGGTTTGGTTLPPPRTCMDITGRVVVIDAGMAVDISHTRAEEFLLRDLTSITTFFGRYTAVLRLDTVHSLILDASIAPHPTTEGGIRTGAMQSKGKKSGRGTSSIEFDGLHGPIVARLKSILGREKN